MSWDWVLMNIEWLIVGVIIPTIYAIGRFIGWCIGIKRDVKELKEDKERLVRCVTEQIDKLDKKNDEQHQELDLKVDGIDNRLNRIEGQLEILIGERDE